jgi:hypothetical protein
LYVLGHGNWGAGMGTHGTHYGAGRLSQQLVDFGLAAQQTALEIHLYGCNTGVAGARVFGTRKPYVLRLGEALAAKGFTNTRVIGYVGFLAVLSLTLTSTYKGGKPSGNHGQLSDANRQVVYQVQGGVCTQVSGGSWGMKSTFAWRTVNIVQT